MAREGPSWREEGWGAPGQACWRRASRHGRGPWEVAWPWEAGHPQAGGALTTAAAPLGLLCHLNDACISNPCNEGSNCDTNPVNGKAICTCPSGYTGPACSQDVDECSLGTSGRGMLRGA